MAKIELATYMENLRSEIEKGAKLAEGKNLRFFNDKIELEIEIGVEVDLEGSGEAKFRFLVFDISSDAKASRKNYNKQKIKFSLTPAFKEQDTGVWLSGSGQKMTG